MKRERPKDAHSSIGQRGVWPSRVSTRPSCSRAHLDLCGFAVVALKDAAEFGSAANSPFGLWDKVFFRAPCCHDPHPCEVFARDNVSATPEGYSRVVLD